MPPATGGISYDAHCKAIAATECGRHVAFAKEEAFDYVVVAQDDPLALGMVDALAAVGIPAFGPDKAAARIEASKVFSKNLMQKYGIPTADYAVFDDPAKVIAYVEEKNKYPVVIKADGLALGKGVLICQNHDDVVEAVKEIMLDKKFGASGNHVVVEEFLTGPEVSVLSFCDGKTVKPMVSSMDPQARAGRRPGSEYRRHGHRGPQSLLYQGSGRPLHAGDFPAYRGGHGKGRLPLQGFASTLA